jgi:hypothetical protein
VPWQLIRLATKPAGSRAAARIAASPFAVVVSMVLDQIDARRLLLIEALKHNRLPKAKELLTEIRAIDETMKESIDLDGSEWGKRLDRLIEEVDVSLEAEIASIPSDHLHLMHKLEAFRPRKSSGGRLGRLVRSVFTALRPPAAV